MEWQTGPDVGNNLSATSKDESNDSGDLELLDEHYYEPNGEYLTESIFPQV